MRPSGQERKLRRMLTAHPSWDVLGHDAHSSFMALTCAPGGGVCQCVGHPGREQRFRITQGSMLLEVDGSIRVVRTGQEARVPAGARHRWAVHGPVELRADVVVRPG